MKNRTTVNSKNAPAPIGPYNQGRFAGDTLYISGQIPLDAETGEMVNDNIETATKKVMDNIGHILKEAGLSFNDVVKCSIYLTDINNFAKVNEVYGSYFPDISPAREAFQVVALPKGAEVEVSAIATKQGS